jgi:hypothetical protein
MRRPLLFVVLACGCAFGQIADSTTFEVASVKPTPPPEPGARVFYGPPRGGPGTSDPGQITWTNAARQPTTMPAIPVRTSPPPWKNSSD